MNEIQQDEQSERVYIVGESRVKTIVQMALDSALIPNATQVNNH